MTANDDLISEAEAAGCTPLQVATLRDYAKPGATIRGLARAYGVTPNSVRDRLDAAALRIHRHLVDQEHPS